MNMADYGQRLGLMGLESMNTLANLENRRRLTAAEQAQLESRAQGEGLGSLAGMAIGGASAGLQEYSANKKGGSKPINGIIDGMRDQEEKKPDSADPVKMAVVQATESYEPYQPYRQRQLDEVRGWLEQNPEAITDFQRVMSGFPRAFISR